ncbi:DEDD exonuclease domain-containing protein [Cellulomonas marina]|uniref:DNA polymerase-3 subunit epsilon n=1 Tax=Cellulomonas marina TaxID=988821 RepID=A0A1I0W0Y2_9CELL|nr:DEDD exonuclease domain-containing protein [Cellulomonas marina]SFA82184.1 DNA polymerase-3 subunit epsilon [Cellulomonas marina]
MPDPLPPRVPTDRGARAAAASAQAVVAGVGTHLAPGLQVGFDDLGTPLHEVTFVVVDLETTGGSAAECGITEIGAVKVRGGQVLGEFATLVDPGEPVPPQIQVLTGITTAMLVGAPRIEEVLPAFLEFARGCVLVAHNAPFDVGFLTAAARRTGHPWPGFPVVDTVRLARRVVTRDEAPNHRLATLAALFHASVVPEHRALGDAQATVDVLHALLARLAPLGVTHLEDLATAADPVPADVRRKRTLADGLPHAPGVYLFRGPRDEVLYVGTSTTSLRTRVRTYFTAGEKRGRMTEMVRLATRVDAVVCATPLEARVRELRLITEHSPRYNRRSRFPERMPWVRLTVEPFPRLSVVRQVRDEPGAAWIGPFPSTGAATLAVEALHAAFPVRQCTRRLPAVAPAGASACVLAEVGRCGAPCTGGQDLASYATVVDGMRAAMTGDPWPVVSAHARRITALAAQHRYEEATTVRDRLQAYLRGAARTQRIGPLARTPELVAAAPVEGGGWELVVVRHGRLAATARVDRRTDPRPVVEALRASAEHVAAPGAPAPACHPEETDLVLAWLDRPGVRLVHAPDGWASPVRGAQSVSDVAAAVTTAVLLATRTDDDDVPAGDVARPVTVAGPVLRGRSA